MKNAYCNFVSPNETERFYRNGCNTSWLWMQMLINRIDIWESGFCEKKKTQSEKMKKKKTQPTCKQGARISEIIWKETSPIGQ